MKKSAKILIVEDEIIISETLRIVLNEDGYNNVEVCNTYDESVSTLSSFQPHLTLLDINLKSDKTGIDLAHLINEKYKSAFIFLSSYTDKKTLDLAWQEKPKDFLVKPVDYNHLLSIIKNTIAEI